MSDEKRSDDIALWWGTHRFDDEQLIRWTIGPLTLWVRALEHEWRVLHEQSTDPTLDTVARDDAAEPPGDTEQVERFGFSASREPLRLEPALPDRPLVARPEMPLSVLARHEVVIHVSLPLWIALFHDGDRTPMLEVPTVQLSNTWFGGPTRPGGLCYALRTRARLHLENQPINTLRAWSSVTIRNRADEHLRLERMRIPTPELSLFYDRASGRFETETVTIERKQGRDLADVKFGEGPSGSDAELVRAPREQPERTGIMRAIDALLG